MMKLTKIHLTFTDDQNQHIIVLKDGGKWTLSGPVDHKQVQLMAMLDNWEAQLQTVQVLEEFKAALGQDLDKFQADRFKASRGTEQSPIGLRNVPLAAQEKIEIPKP